jgi:hypothetical protein
MRHRSLLLVCVIAVAGGVQIAVGAASAAGGRRERAPLGRGGPSLRFAPLTAPAVSSFSPSSAITGSHVTITGTSLGGARSVKFGTRPASFTVVSATQIDAVVPNGALPAPISVTTAAGTGTSASNFSPTLSITGFGPTSAAYGTVVKVRGIGFNSSSTVAFAGGAASSVAFVSASQLDATVPNTAMAGPITVSNSVAPTGAVQSARSYTVTGPFRTVPSSETGLPPAGIPRPDATCAAEVTPTAENRPQNATANDSVPSDPSSITWNPNMDYWTSFIADRDQVTGDYTGTTDEILQWVACKWGIDENLVRADAVVESDWIQSTIGDNCGVAGEASYGILQVKNEDCSGTWIHGGWPYTENDTALDADYWGARMRACFDGAFYDGGTWLYRGQTMAQIIAAHGENYALWGCVGSWYSGSWYDSGARSYIATVQSVYRSKPWLQPGF